MFQKKIVQDNLREQEMIRLFGLIGGVGRDGVDATDEFGREYELKTTSKGGVSTARDAGYNHLDKWKPRYWLIGDFENRSEGFHFKQFYLLTPDRMAGWYEKIRDRLDASTRIKDQIIAFLRAAKAPEELIAAGAKLLSDGALLNDPNIPKGYIQQNGILITSDYQEKLREHLSATRAEVAL